MTGNEYDTGLLKLFFRCCNYDLKTLDGSIPVYSMYSSFTFDVTFMLAHKTKIMSPYVMYVRGPEITKEKDPPPSILLMIVLMCRLYLKNCNQLGLGCLVLCVKLSVTVPLVSTRGLCSDMKEMAVAGVSFHSDII